MAQGYKVQNARTAVNGVTLTAAYSGNRSSSFTIGGYDQAVLAVSYTPKVGQSNRNLYVKVEFSYDGGTDWYPLSISSDAAVASNIVVGTIYDYEFKFAGAAGGTEYFQRVPLSLADYGVGNVPLMRISVKEDGSDNFGVASVILMLSGI
jgi:hypothetical protein